MRYLLISDIHANWEALQAVLEDAHGTYDQILCLGDLVGYGPDPNAVVEWARLGADSVIRGNHDKACTGDNVIEWFNPVATLSAVWTMQVLRPSASDYLKALPQGPLTVENFQICHGSPLDEDEYVINLGDVPLIARTLSTRMVFFGHTHLQGGFQYAKGRVRRIPQTPLGERERVIDIEPDWTYLINPGSVGQPRDGDPRAGYALYEASAASFTLRRVAYDVAATQQRILAAGLPGVLAARLDRGA